MPAFINRAGQKHGRLTFHVRVEKYQWLCKCQCGNWHIANSNNIVSGKTQSCGCQRQESSTKHGMYQRPEYTVWACMKHRCESEANYAGRGIKVCDRWKESFATFFADMGPRPSPEHSINRIDNDGDYEPDNCEWATRCQQMRNTRRNRLITYDGRTKCVVEWAEELNLPHYILRERLSEGWTLERAFTEPVNWK